MRPRIELDASGVVDENITFISGEWSRHCQRRDGHVTTAATAIAGDLLSSRAGRVTAIQTHYKELSRHRDHPYHTRTEVG